MWLTVLSSFTFSSPRVLFFFDRFYSVSSPFWAEKPKNPWNYIILKLYHTFCLILRTGNVEVLFFLLRIVWGIVRKTEQEKKKHCNSCEFLLIESKRINRLLSTSILPYSNTFFFIKFALLK